MTRRGGKTSIGPRQEKTRVSELMYRTVLVAPDAVGIGDMPAWQVDLATTPIEIIPKPASGKAIMVERALLQMGPGDDACATDGDLALRYKGGTGDDLTQAIDDFCNDATAGKVMTMEAAGTEAEPQTVGLLQPDLAVELYASASLAAAAGTNPITITVLYRIVDVQY